MARPFIDVRTFDPTGSTLRDGQADWTQILQDAITYLITGIDRSMAMLPGPPERGTLYLPPGIYRITRPLLIANPGPASFLPCSIAITGDSANPRAAGHTATLLTDYKLPNTFIETPNWPAIIIQGGRSVHLRKLFIRGQNGWSPPLGTFDPTAVRTQLHQDLTDGATDPYLSSIQVRDVAASPHAGVCIDPLHLDVGTSGKPGVDEQYPDILLTLRTGDMPLALSALYKLGSPKSQDIVIEDCRIQFFVVGVCVSPGGRDMATARPDQMDLTFYNTQVANCKTCLSVSGDYRAVLHSAGLGFCKHCINCVDYDAGQNRPGLCPSIFGANVGGTRQIFKTGNAGGHASINGMYVESTLSYGQLGVPLTDVKQPMDSYSFNGCVGSLINPQNELDPDTKTPAPLPSGNAFLINLARTTFSGCVVAVGPLPRGTPLPSPSLHVINYGYLSFDGCTLGLPHTDSLDLGPQFWVSGKPEQVEYNNVRVFDVLQNAAGGPFPTPIFLSSAQAVQTFGGASGTLYLASQAVPGSFYYYFDHQDWQKELDDLNEPDPKKRAGFAPGLRYVSGQSPIIPLGPAPGRPFPKGALQIQTRKEGAVDVPTGTATLVVEAGIVQKGDVLAIEGVPGVLLDGGAGPALLGRVSDVAMDGVTLTLSYVPIALRKGFEVETKVTIAYFPRIHPPTTGTVDTSNVNVITSVAIKPPNPSLEISWGRGHRIFGDGIPIGAYIKNIEYTPMASKITISKSFISTARSNPTDLLDADIYGIDMSLI